MKKYLFLLLVASCLSACTSRMQSQIRQQNHAVRDNQQAFIQNLKALCGKTFEGVAVFPDEPSEPFRNARLFMVVETCNTNDLRIPFLVGEDKSRTWVLSSSPEGLLFKHDHRHEDGTPDEITHYGGFSDAAGTALQQNFPADAFTASLIPAAATNVWRLRLSENGTRFSYILERDGKMRFQADFDLTKPVIAE